MVSALNAYDDPEGVVEVRDVQPESNLAMLARRGIRRLQCSVDRPI